MKEINPMTDIAIFMMDLRGGGAEKALLYVAAGLAARGLKVDLVLVKAEGPYLSLISPKVNIVPLHKFRLLASLPALISYLRRRKPAVIISTLSDTDLILLWARSLARVSTRVVLSIQNNVSQCAQNASRLKHRLTPFLISLFYPRADEIIAVSCGVARDLAKITKVPLKKIHVIYNPIIIPEIQDAPRQYIKHPWFSSNATDGPPIILGAGRLEHQKDFPTLIRAFAMVRRRFPAKLAILGEGSLREDLESLVASLGLSEDVSFLGFVDYPHLYISQAKIFALSSLFEGFGNVLGEALAVGTPVVSTDCESGPAEILGNGKYGKLVPVEDYRAMADAIIETLEHPPAKEFLCLRGKEFSLDKIVEQYYKVLSSYIFEPT